MCGRWSPAASGFNAGLHAMINAAMANRFDLLEALDHYLSDGRDELSGYEVHGVAQAAKLLEHGSTQAARWVGDLVADGCLTYRSKYPGTSDLAPGVRWTDRELQSRDGYRLTLGGREEVDRQRRRRRELATDALLEGWLDTSPAELPGGIMRPLVDLRSALDQERHPAAVAAAKDLVEAACKGALDRSGAEPPPASASLPALFSAARRCSAHSDADIGRSLSAIVDRLARLRNSVGGGHGRLELDQVAGAEARIAAGAACAVARFLLEP